MIDDDEIAEPVWIDEMVKAAREQRADIVGGPVLPIFPDEARRAPFAIIRCSGRPSAQTGPVPMIYGTGNCLVARHVFDGLAEPGLDHSFNFLGGGDTEFFTRCRRAGYTFYLAPGSAHP